MEDLSSSKSAKGERFWEYASGISDNGKTTYAENGTSLVG